MKWGISGKTLYRVFSHPKTITQKSNLQRPIPLASINPKRPLRDAVYGGNDISQDKKNVTDISNIFVNTGVVKPDMNISSIFKKRKF